jgi:hypothetical protein
LALGFGAGFDAALGFGLATTFLATFFGSLTAFLLTTFFALTGIDAFTFDFDFAGFFDFATFFATFAPSGKMPTA